MTTCGARPRRERYLATAQAPALREGRVFTPIAYGGIEFFDDSMEGIGAMEFLRPDDAHFFPVGIPELFIEADAPAPYAETVNTLALPRYAMQEMMPFDKGMEIEAATERPAFAPPPHADQRRADRRAMSARMTCRTSWGGVC